MATSDRDPPLRGSAAQPDVDRVIAVLEAAGQSDRYRDLALVGAGGIGVVYRASDRRLHRAVAIKAIQAPPSGAARTTSRLRAEALTAASLDHPYICKVYELIETGGEQLIVMEFVEGETLAGVLGRGVPPLATTLRWAIEIAEGLAAAHDHGLVHRDLKPSNVMVTPHRHVKLLDFGLARADPTAAPDADTHTPPPFSDAYAGTPHYMAPEQATGKPVTVRTDVFALGVLLFRCVTGRLPFEGATPYDYTRNLLSRHPAPLHHLAPDIPADLARLIARCLEKRPADRPESAAAIVAELRQLADTVTATNGAGRSVRAARARRRWRVAAATAGVALLGAVAWRWALDADLADVVWQAHSLVTSSNEELRSRISPDGAWVSYLSVREGRPELMVRRMDGGEPLRVSTPEGTLLSQLWSPDTTSLAFVVRRETEAMLQVVPAFFGGAPVVSVPLSPVPVGARLLRWIDRTIYLEVRDSRGRGLHQVDLVDGRSEDLSGGWTIPGTFNGFDVSPDGRRVVYSLTADQEDLWIANLDGTAARRLTNDQFFEHYPLWSARGPSVIYQSNRGGQLDLWEVGITGSSRARPLTSSPTTEEPESTSADGRLITYRQVSDTSNLWIWNPSNRAGAQLTDDALVDHSPVSATRDAPVVFQRGRPSALLGNPLSDSMLLMGILDGLKFQSMPAVLTEGFAARLSPDGSRLAYLTRGLDPQRATLVVRDLRHGGTVTLSTTCPVAAYSSVPLDWAEQNLAWSASGTDLYFVDRPGEFVLRRYSVGTAAASGGLVTTGARESIHDLHLSADARTLAYVVSSQSGSELHLFDVLSGRDRSVTPLGGPANARGWLVGDAGVIIVRRGRVREDARVEIAVSQVSGTGVLHEIGRLDHVVSATVRLHQPRSAVYATRSENGVHNVYEYSLRTRTVRRLTDNTLPGVTFSGVEAAGPHLLGVRFERRSDIWVMDGAAPAR